MQAPRDQNFVTTLLAVSSVDGVTPVTLYANPTTHRLLVDLAGGGSGTVQTISVATANGFAGVSDGDANNPTLTLSTTVTGILKGNGTAISAVTIGSGLSFDGTTLSASGGGGGMTSFTLAGDTGTAQTITDGNTVTIAGGTGIDTVASATDTVTVNLDSASVASLGKADTAIQNLAGLGITATATELNYTTGVTSAIQTQLNSKQATITGGATTIATSDLTANRALISNASGKVDVATTTATEIGYLNGVTSAIQDQIDGKLIGIQNNVTHTTFGGSAGSPTNNARITYSVAIGEGALVTGPASGSVYDNVAIGFESQNLNETGITNVAIGSQTLKNNVDGMANVAIGYQAMFTPTTSDYCTVVGERAGYDLTTGTNNTFLGTSTGRGITTGGKNTIIGANVTGLSATLNNNVIIADGDGNQRINVDNNGVVSMPGGVVSRVGTVASSASPTPNASTDDMYTVTALAVGATLGAPTGTPTNGQKIIIRIKDNGTARALGYNAIYRAIGVTLPTTTVASKTIYMGIIYNSADSKWDVTAVAQE